MIEVLSLSKRFGRIHAVDEVKFQVRPGEILGFLGPNGAGKSTTMKMLTGFLPPDSGTARIGGFDIQGDALAAKRLFGYLPETGPLYPEMTVQAFLQFCAEMRGLRGKEQRMALDKVCESCHLHTVLRQTLETLSKGYRQRVGLAQAVLHDPAYLILDEPTDGLDPNQKNEVRRLIAAMAAEKAIILSTHILEEVEAMCSRVIIINHGKIVADATPAELKQQHPDHGCLRIGASTAELQKVADWASANDLVWQSAGAGVAILRSKSAQPDLQARVMERTRLAGWELQRIEPLPTPLDAVFAKLTLNTLN